MSASIKVRLLSITLMSALASCYYDNEAILYPETATCVAPENPSFQTEVLPLLNTRCNTCHAGTAPSGGIRLNSFTEVSKYVNDGSLMGSINHWAGYSAMPKGAGKMPACEISKIQNWITSGALDN